jgi:soluble lytic murein transglycosylase
MVHLKVFELTTLSLCFSAEKLMPIRRLPLLVAVTAVLSISSLIAFSPPRAFAELPTKGVLPPSFCSSHACSQGLHAYALGEYSKAAKTWEEAAKTLPKGEGAWRARVDLIILTADAWERAGEASRAGMAYLKASKLAKETESFLQFKAAHTLVQADEPPLDILERISASNVLNQGYPGSALVAARIDALRTGGLPSPKTALAAFESGQRETTCQWLSETLVETKSQKEQADKGRFAKLVDLTYGHCLPAELAEGYGKLAVSPSDEMQLARADRFYGAVRFPEAFSELKDVDLEKLDAVDKCRAQFRLGRTLYRQKMRSASIENYKKVAESCVDPANEDERISSLYAVGRMQYWRDQFDASKKNFQSVLEDYPERSHADDALLYLARIARKQSKSDHEKKLVEKALRDYPQGDMVHEIAWEYLEEPYRNGKHKEFLAKLGALELPDSDAQYFSQGRLEYFSGKAWEALGRKDSANKAWKSAWEAYPFSFYGYLSRQRLVEAGVEPMALAEDVDTRVADWFVDETWAKSGAQRLAQLGLYDLAADMEKARLSPGERTDSDRWRLAYLEHKAERFPVSHNIARRTIVGRPWASPAAGRLVRWNIAWPSPFADDIRRAIVAEKRQATGTEFVEPALPAAIMREESSFIEDIESWAGALGLMQLMPATARGHDDDIEGVATPERLKTSKVNIRVGVDHLYYLARRFESHPVLMAAAYNAGGGAVSGWIRRKKTSDIGLFVEDIPYDEARNYSKRVIGSYAAYQWLGGIRDLDPTIARDP